MYTLTTDGLREWVTVDTPPPDGWIGQRVVIYVLDAIVGSGTLVKALPITDDPDDFADPIACIQAYVNGRELYYWPEGATEDEEAVDISDQLPLQDWSPGRWALRFTDVAPTGERRPWPWLGCNERCVGRDDCVIATTCRVADGCPPVLAPVLSGDDPTYREWRV